MADEKVEQVEEIEKVEGIKKVEDFEKIERPENVDLTALDAGTSKEAAHLPDQHGDSAEARATSFDSSLPPADGGKAAWLFLAACWVIEALVFGECM